MAMPPIDLCFTNDFLNYHPCHLTTSARISTRIVALTPSMRKSLRLKIWWTSVKGRCHSNQFCGAKRQHVDTPCFYCLCWHFTTVGKIAKFISHWGPWCIPNIFYKFRKLWCIKSLRCYGVFAESGWVHTCKNTFAVVPKQIEGSQRGCCVNSAIDLSTSGKNFTNFGPVTPES